MNQKLYKYPRTFHFPNSPGATSDDKVLDISVFDNWNHEVVVTEKRDGENTTLYKDYFHARSLDSKSHESRTKVAALHATIAHEIPDNWRICGENLTAKHSIKYTDLTSIFEVFSIWDGDSCLSWDETVEFSELLDLPVVPVLWRGLWNPSILIDIPNRLDLNKQEGFVVRPVAEFKFEDFGSLLGKFVRAGHVQSSSHWMHEKIEYNVLIHNE